MALGHGQLPLLSSHPLLFPGGVVAGGAGGEVTQLAPEDDLRGAEAGDGVRGVAVGQQGSGQGICVEGARRAQAVKDEALGRLHSDLGTFVATRMICG